MVSSSEPIVSATGSNSAETSTGSISSTVTTPTGTTSTQTTPQATLSPTEQAAKERERIASDLERWQKKFAVAADRGVEDLDERLQGIVESHITSGIKGHGESLSTALESVVESELTAIKQRINTLAGSLPLEDVPVDEEQAQDELLDDIRQAAFIIRGRAHTLREWYNSFDDELVRRVSAAVNSTLDILDNVRDLGLQEIGMRWAWMDGVTYKDWEKYHALKVRFETWRHEISDVGMQHKTVEEARILASEVLDHGMNIAETSAKELARLKDVGRWKIAARESSDNFDTRSDPPPTWPKPSDESDTADENLAQTETESSHSDVDAADAGSETESAEADQELHDATPGADQRILKADGDSPSQETRSVASIPTRSSEADYVGSTVEDQINKKTHDSANIWGVAASEVLPEQMPFFQDPSDDGTEDLNREQFSETLQSLVSKAGDRYPQVTEAASEVLLASSAGYSHALSAASHALYGTEHASVSGTVPAESPQAIEDVYDTEPAVVEEALSSVTSNTPPNTVSTGPAEAAASPHVIKDEASRRNA